MADNNDYPPQGGQGFPPDNKDGTPSLIGKDEYTRWEATQRLNRVPTTVLAGNFADLQRLGTEVATNTTVNSALAPPPGINPKDDNVVTPAQQEAARGEWTRETERVGTLDAPPAHVPADNTEPDSIDPGSQSPVQVSKQDQKSTTTATAPKTPTK